MEDWHHVARASLRSGADRLAQGKTRWSTPLSSIAPNSSFVNALARSILASDANVDAITDSCAQTLGKRWRWIKPLAARYLEAYVDRTRPRRRELVRFLLSDKGFKRAWSRRFDEVKIVDQFVGTPKMQPVGVAQAWDLPPIRSIADLSDWCGLRVEELEWFADLKEMGHRQSDSKKLQHYNYRVSAKRSGGFRVIESPKVRLKALQRQILALILDRVPVHPAAHGFARGRSIKTFAEPHVGHDVVLRIDLRDFFPSIRRARIQTLFRTMGYPETVADLLGGICTNAVPYAAWNGLDRLSTREFRDTYRRPHLPQGAPTSPALANLCAYRVDCRLSGLANVSGAIYTRYADDLAFSGGAEFARAAERFSAHAGAILIEEGFAPNYRKTRIMRQGVRQHLAGLVVNRHTNVKRDEFDQLRALLHNCVRFGPEGQNREGYPAFAAHLAGRISFVEAIRPARGAKLRRLYEKIRWL